jgi:excisionase family DNA binding protein
MPKTKPTLDAGVSPGALKLKEARQYLGGLSAPTIHRLIHRGVLRPNRMLRHLLFSREELDRFLRDGMT